MYFSNSQDQKYVVQLFFRREIEHLVFCSSKIPDPQVKLLGVKLQALPQEDIDEIILKYIEIAKKKTQ